MHFITIELMNVRMNKIIGGNLNQEFNSNRYPGTCNIIIFVNNRDVVGWT